MVNRSSILNFEDFRKDLETKLESLEKFELQEFHFKPHSFGNGILAYRIKGKIHKFIFSGRENELTWAISKPHEKYFGANFSLHSKFEGLEISLDDLEKGTR